MENTPSKPIILMPENYRAVIRNAVGSKMFRNFYAIVDGEKKDLVNDGDLSCGFFVSSVLYLFQLIADRHLTVASTEKDLINSGWQEVPLTDIPDGAVLLWQSQRFDDGEHGHIGFALGDGRAVSTDSKQGIVAEHSIDFDGTRPVVKAYWHDKISLG